MRRLILGIVTHGAALGAGFALGLYALPILTAPPGPDADTLRSMAAEAVYRAEFAEDLPGNDLLHWGRGTVSLTRTQIVHDGNLAPGPDYVVYLVPDFVDHEDTFLPLKADSLPVGPVRSFSGFALDLPPGTDLDAFTTVLVWCEAFGEFIAAARYR